MTQPRKPTRPGSTLLASLVGGSLWLAAPPGVVTAQSPTTDAAQSPTAEVEATPDAPTEPGAEAAAATAAPTTDAQPPAAVDPASEEDVAKAAPPELTTGEPQGPGPIATEPEESEPTAEASATGGLSGDPEPASEPELGAKEGMLFGRGLLGLGFASLDTDRDRDAGINARGLAINWDAALGANVLKNLAAHVNFFGVNAVFASVKEGGVDNDDSNSGLAIAGIGAGATYHVQPINLYLSFVAGMGWTLVAPLNSPAGFGRLGLGSEVILGKDWWIREGLAVGAAAQAVYVRVSDDGIDYNGFGGGVGINFTYR